MLSCSLYVFVAVAVSLVSAQNFIHVKQTLTWQDAEAYCLSQYGTHLASFSTDAEAAEIRQMVTENAWIGLNDIDVEGYWQFSDGAVDCDAISTTSGCGSAFAYWNNGEPNGANDVAYCGHVWALTTTTSIQSMLDDFPCSSQLYFVCNAHITTTTCDKSSIATFDWNKLTETGEAKPEVVAFSMDVDETDLSLNIEVALTYERKSSIECGDDAVYGTTYVLDFEDYNAHADSIARPGTCQNRVADDFTGAFDTFWEYSLNPSSDLGSASYLAYPPPGDLWSVAADATNECGVVIYIGKFSWNDLVSCQDYAQTASYVTTTDADEKLTLSGTFYVNLVSPYAYDTDTSYYRVYQLLSQPFVIQVHKNIQVINAAGINLFTISVIAVYKETQASMFKLIVLTESAEYLELSRTTGEGLVAFESSSVENSQPLITSFSVADTAENDGCLNNKAYICSQLWQIESPGDCSSARSQYIDFSGDYSLQFTPMCRDAADVGTELAAYCDAWLLGHPDVEEGVGLTATLQWRDEECDPILFEVQFQAEMLFFTDELFTASAQSDTLYQVGEDRIFVQVDTDFPSDAFDVFDTQLLSVWICTFDPLSGPTLPIEAGALSGGCFSDSIDGFVSADADFGADNIYAYHIFDAQSTVTVPEVVAFEFVGHPSTLDADKDKVRFSFVVPPHIARDTLYIHAQIEVALNSGARRRQLLKARALANQMEHFLGNVGVATEAQPRDLPQPLPAPHQVPVSDTPYLLTLQSPWVMAIIGLLAVIFTFNIAFMCYLRCCGGNGADGARVSFARQYKFVDANDSSSLDESEVQEMNGV